MDIEHQILKSDTEHEKATTLSNRTWEVFGFGTQYLWLLSIIFGSIVFEISESSGWAEQVRLFFICGLAVANLLIFIARRFIPFEHIDRLAILSAGALGTLGTVLVIFPSSGVIGFIILTVASLLMGASNAVLMIGGNKAWSESRPERMIIHIATSAFVASILYYVLDILPSTISVVVICLLPLIGSVILSSTRKGRPRASSYRKVTHAKRSTTVRVLAFVVCFAFTAGIMIGSVTHGEFEQLSTISRLMLSGAVFAGAIAFLCALYLPPTVMLKMLGTLGMPLMIIGCVLVFLLPSAYRWLSYAVIMAGFVLCDLFMWLLNAELVSRTGKSPFEILSRSCFVEWGGLFAGFAVANYVVQSAGSGVVESPWLFAYCVILLTIINNFVFTPIDSVRIIEIRDSVIDRENIEDACSVIAERYGLTAREAEIMTYLAKGRSIPYIQEQMQLSQSTIKTHMRNMYRKLPARNKQTLISMIESFS